MHLGPRIAFYVTAHGFGHGVRSCDIVRALSAYAPEHPVVVISDLPEDFLASRLGAGAGGLTTFRRAACDVGMAQVDSIRVDLDETLRQVRHLFDRADEVVRREAEFLNSGGFGLVVSDIPSLPIEAAKAAGLPCAAVGNFAWDWIYEEFAARDGRWSPIVERIRRGYACADLLLRLPFAEEMTAFPRRVDIPLVAEPGIDRRGELAEHARCEPGSTWVLLSFASLDWDAEALQRVRQMAGYEFLTVRPLAWEGRNIHPLDRRDFRFSDVLASVDVVVTKPGFGVLSDCAVNDKPIVYSDRSDFREYAVLERAVRGGFRCAHLPSELLYCGELTEAIEAARRAPAPAVRPPMGGGPVAARLLCDLFVR
jgi:hypothetical protein